MRRLIVCVALLAACQRAETAEQAAQRIASESAAARSAIDAINLRYERYLNENLADSVAALFAEDGVMMPPNAPAVAGRGAIAAYLAAAPMPPGSRMKFSAVDVTANGPVMVERGTYTFTMPATATTPAVDIPGKYLVHWRDVNGTWLQVATSWSDDAPPPPPDGR